MQKISNKKIVLVGLLCLAGFASLFIQNSKSVFAQSGTDSLWSAPYNVSKLGGATNPISVVGNNTVVHIIWQDKYEGWVYVQGSVDRWSEPEKVNIPVGKVNVKLISDYDGYIHAFWNDEKGALFYSSVLSDRFNNPTAWAPVQFLVNSAADYAVDVDRSGGINLVYIPNIYLEAGTEKQIIEDVNSGVFLQQLERGLGVWSAPKTIFQSDYYRLLSKSNANIQITADKDSDTIFVAWDDILRRRVYMARTIDGGNNWDTPQEVDGPLNQLGTEQPFNIRVGANNQGVIRLWQKGLMGEYCSQYFQVSTDNGETWGEPQLMFAGLYACPEDNSLYGEFDDFIFLKSIIQDQMYWLVFNDGKWSEPKIQSEISSFTDLETLFTVKLGCTTLMVVPPSTVLYMGCDLNPGGDIWLLSRELGEILDWFPPLSIWSEPVTLIDLPNAGITFPILAADSKNQLHAFWLQIEESSISSKEKQLYYAFWDGFQWTKPLAVLGLVDVTVLEPFDVKITDDDRILVAWNGQPWGTIYFSWANADRAYLSSEWSTPIPITSLATDHLYENSPNILIDVSNKIGISYSISINEGRGIYTTESVDRGETWSEPINIIDGVENEIQVVGSSEIAKGSNNAIHLIFGLQESPFVSSIKNIFYAMGGLETPEINLVEELFKQEGDERISWFKLLTNQENGVHQLWQTKSTLGPSYVWHRYSTDGGLTFSSLPSLQRFSESIGTVDATLDVLGRPHLVLVDQTTDGRLLLRHQLFEEEIWKIVDDFNITSPQKFYLRDMSTIQTPNGNLGVILTGEIQKIGFDTEDVILFLRRFPTEFFDQPVGELPVPSETPSGTGDIVEETAAVEPTLTPTPESQLINKAPYNSGLNDSILIGPIIGGSIVLIIVIIVIIRSVGLSSSRNTDS